MAEEVKKTEATEEQVAPKVVYGYTVRRYDNGFYDFEPITLEGAETPSIDQYHIALDAIDLGRKLDHQILVEEAEQRVMMKLTQMAQQAEQAQPEADPTK